MPWATICRRSAASLNADCPSGTHAPENGQSRGFAEQPGSFATAWHGVRGVRDSRNRQTRRSAPGDWPFWDYKMDALLTAEAYSGGAERRKNVAHGVSRGFPGAPHASPGGATDNLEQGALLQLCRPCRGLRFIRTSYPRLAPWATVWRRSAAFLNADCPSGTHTPVNGQSPAADQEVCPTCAWPQAAFRGQFGSPMAKLQALLRRGPGRTGRRSRGGSFQNSHGSSSWRGRFFKNGDELKQ